MNYFELHIGDYEKKTAHLTACEDGIYGRLVRRYYDTEAPLPKELPAVQRLVRAHSRDEKAAVGAMLQEFFRLADDGWHHSRCDEEIAKYQDKRAKAQRSAEARWNKTERNANASPNAMRTHSEGNAHQSPDTSHQTRTEDSPALGDHEREATAAGRACLAMRQAGCGHGNPSDPDLRAALAEGVTAEALADTVREAVAQGIRRPFRWAITTARGRHADGARAVVASTGPPTTGMKPSRQFQALTAMQGLIEEAHERESEPVPVDRPRLVHGGGG